MELKLKINKKERLAYIPRALYNILGPDVRATPNCAAVLMCSSKTSINDALRSLEIIKADLQQARQLQKNTSQEVKE